MSQNNYNREREALYIIIVKDNAAEHKLRAWAKSSPHNACYVEGNRLKLFDDQSFNRFRITWQHEWTHIIIWDTWNRRHLELVQP